MIFIMKQEKPMIETDAKDVFAYLHEPEVNCFMSMKLDTLEDAVNELKR